ncbi:MAG: hypothetical protein SFU86_05505 [Pirellulaceae bacterium]|nr:hypothetical protein [Pirellulaceae bacterium]
MNQNAAFVRKVGYIVAIGLLLLPLSALSQPATVNRRGEISPGGKLAQMRTQFNLSQAELGAIDPASETMKLATLGLRGVATNFLWIAANHYKMVEDWDKLELTVKQIIRLQPNFLEVWDFQAHNLSYNVSVEFDDYRMRYQWVKKGIEFLIQGTHYNRQEPGLLNQVGWFTSQKMGRSDEKKQFRRIFKEDDLLHKSYRDDGVEVDQGLGPDGKPDNWLVARLWFNKATDAVTFSGKPIRGKTPLLFYSGGAMSQMNGAANMQTDGYFYEPAQAAWERGAADWLAFGTRELPTTAGFNIRLNDLEQLQARIKAGNDRIDELAPGARKLAREAKIESLKPELKAALEKPQNLRNRDEIDLANQAEGLIFVTPREVGAKAPPEAKAEIRAMIEQLENDALVVMKIASDRKIVNFEYWRTRCEAERGKLAQDAHKAVYDADRLFAEGEKFGEARKRYEEAWNHWAAVYKQFPVLMDNAESQDLIDSIKQYRSLLNQLDEPFPVDFVLNDMLELHHEGRDLKAQVRLLSEAAGDKPAPKRSDGQNPPANAPEPTPAEPPKENLPEGSKSETPETDK